MEKEVVVVHDEGDERTRNLMVREVSISSQLTQPMNDDVSLNQRSCNGGAPCDTRCDRAERETGVGLFRVVCGYGMIYRMCGV